MKELYTRIWVHPERKKGDEKPPVQTGIPDFVGRLESIARVFATKGDSETRFVVKCVARGKEATHVSLLIEDHDNE